MVGWFMSVNQAIDELIAAKRLIEIDLIDRQHRMFPGAQ
jgi:hypothetical protein